MPIDAGAGRRHPVVVFGDHRLCAGERVVVQPMPAAHMHSQVEINYVLSGEMTYWFDRRTVRLGVGRLAMFWGMMPHQVTDAPGKTTFVCLYLPISILLAPPLAGRLSEAVLSGAFVSAAAVSPWEGEVFLRWRRELMTGDGRLAGLVRDEIVARMRRIDVEGWEDLCAPTDGGSFEAGPDAGRLTAVEAMARFIAENGRRGVQVADVARAANLHPNYAMDQFRRAFGMTIKQALTRHRLDAAQATLISSDRSIASIAFDCGFGSLSSFYEAFEKRFSVSPANFRRAILAGKARRPGSRKRALFGEKRPLLQT